jgi:hypothetical protein
MEDRLSVLKSTFGEIVDAKENNVHILKQLETRIQHIKKIYSDFIQANREQLFVFTLDSFHFQGKLVDLEFEDMSRMFLSITNRMYCDYYKLFKIIVEYVNENIPDKKLTELIRVHDNYPVYKDLEPFKQYDFQQIQSLHEILLVIMTYLHTFITNKEHELKVYQTKNQIGLHIDSFVNTFSFNTYVMNQKAMLFVAYIEFFHKSHHKFLKRFTMKLNLMLSQLNNDIKIDSPAEAKTVKKDMLADLKEQNVDRALLKELRVSISADDISQSGSSGENNRSPSPEEINISDEKSVIENIVLRLPIIETMSELTDDPEAKKMLLFSETGPLPYQERLEPSPASSSDLIESQVEWAEQLDTFIEPEEEDDENVNLTIFTPFKSVME